MVGVMTAPLELLEALAVQEAELAPGIRHVEVFTMRRAPHHPVARTA